jgi:hypothetical protein
MKTKDSKIDSVKHPVYTIDRSLDEKYKGKVLFKEKLDEANRVLKTYGVPKSAQQSCSKELNNQ